jgi:hypothetical protein
MKKSLILSFAGLSGCLYYSSLGHDNSETLNKYPILKDVNLSKKKVQKLTSQEKFPPRMSSVPLELEWKDDNNVSITKNENIKINESEEKKHYFVGGLEALFSCVKELETSKDKCVYVNDGNASIMSRAGLQLHEHPTQYSDYTISHLFRKLLEGMKLVRTQNPEVYGYSPLHFDILRSVESWSNIKIYLKMISHVLLYKLKNGDSISPDEKDVIQMINHSISYMKELNDKIYKETGKKIITRNGRLYWSTDEKLIQKKMENWKILGINCHLVENEEIEKMTLINGKDFKVYALKMPDDGEIHPDIVNNIVEYLTKLYPDRFEIQKNTSLTKVNFDKNYKANEITLKGPNGEKSITGISSLIASLGHNSIFENQKKLYDVILATGITSDWKVKISKDELKKRIKDNNLEQYLKDCRLTPSADMFNLHIKILDHEVNASDVILYARVTQGANMSSSIASKNDLINIASKINRHFVGDWEILSVGSCSRKTTDLNRPQCWNNYFSFGQSGIGVSSSASRTKDYFPHQKK